MLAHAQPKQRIQLLFYCNVFANNWFETCGVAHIALYVRTEDVISRTLFLFTAAPMDHRKFDTCTTSASDFNENLPAYLSGYFSRSAAGVFPTSAPLRDVGDEGPEPTQSRGGGR